MPNYIDGTAEFNAVLKALESSGTVQYKGRHIRAACPVHKGDSPDSFVLFPSGFGYCHSKCQRKFLPREIADALSIDLPDSSGLDVKKYLAAFGLPQWIEEEFGLETVTYRERSSVRIPYMDSKGELLRNRRRLSLHENQKHIWEGTGGRTFPFGLHRLPAIHQFGRCIIVEGESDVFALAAGGIPAIGIPGAGAWRHEYKGYFAGLEIAIWQEPDDAGRSFVDSIGTDIPDAKILRHVEVKDPAELWILRNQEEFKEEIEELWRSALIYKDVLDTESMRERAELLDEIGHFLDDSQFLDRLDEDISSLGYVGNNSPVMACYIALTSRTLSKPMNLLLLAQSAAGKSFAVSTALQFFPESAYQKVDACSPGSFVYDSTPLRHRAFVLTEFDSAPQGDGAFASALRTLFEENRLVYKTTVEDGGQRKIAETVREGPIAVITTAVRSPEIQSETRLLTVPLDDSTEQIHAIARASAESAAGLARPFVNLDAYRRIQRYMELNGPYEVVIPFAPDLFDLMPSEIRDEQRFTRDFQQLLNAIKAVAVLNQRRRQWREGVIVAELDDYEFARKAFVSSFQATGARSLTPILRETYSAIASEPGMSNSQLAEKLGIVPSTSSWRANEIARKGLIVNTGSGNKRQWETAAPLADEVELPSKECLQAHHEFDSNIRNTVQLNTADPVNFEDSSSSQRAMQESIEVI